MSNVWTILGTILLFAAVAGVVYLYIKRNIGSEDEETAKRKKFKMMMEIGCVVLLVVLVVTGVL